MASAWGNSWSTAWGNSWGSIAPATTTTTKGGIDKHHEYTPEEYKKYRQHLERISKIASEDRKYLKTVSDSVEQLSELGIETPELEKITEAPITKGTLRLMPEINYAALMEDLSKIRRYLDILEINRLRLLEEDDEAAFMLLIN